MDAKFTEVNNGLSLIAASLEEQCHEGLAVVNGNIGCSGNNLWGYLYMIVPHDKDLAERVRRSFLGKNPQESLTLIEKIRRVHFDEALRNGLL